jgi:hypothetical protein
MAARPHASPSLEGDALAVVVIALECQSLCVRLSIDPLFRRGRLELRRIAVLLVAAALALSICGCGAGGKPKREVLRSANLLSADLYLRVSGPAGVVDYIVGRLRASAFDTLGRGAFLPPSVRHHRRQKVCSVTRTIAATDSPSLQAWRGRKVRVDVYGDSKGSEAIFCEILPFVLARGS